MPLPVSGKDDCFMKHMYASICVQCYDIKYIFTVEHNKILGGKKAALICVRSLNIDQEKSNAHKDNFRT